MPKQLGNAFDRHALVGQASGKGVAQLMARQREPSGGDIPFQAILDAIFGDSMSTLIQEKMLIARGWADGQPGRQLAVPARGEPHPTLLSLIHISEPTRPS